MWTNPQQADFTVHALRISSSPPFSSLNHHYVIILFPHVIIISCLLSELPCGLAIKRGNGKFPTNGSSFADIICRISLNWGIPKTMGFNTKTVQIWMIWGTAMDWKLRLPRLPMTTPALRLAPLELRLHGARAAAGEDWVALAAQLGGGLGAYTVPRWILEGWVRTTLQPSNHQIGFWMVLGWFSMFCCVVPRHRWTPWCNEAHIGRVPSRSSTAWGWDLSWGPGLCWSKMCGGRTVPYFANPLLNNQPVGGNAANLNICWSWVWRRLLFLLLSRFNSQVRLDSLAAFSSTVTAMFQVEQEVVQLLPAT